MLEVYARIKDFEQYAVSNYGEVINIKTGNKLKPSLRNGYPYINLSLNGKVKPKYIHRLVANTFLNEINSKTIVDHIDTDRTNNCLTNLRFCNTQENCRNTKISLRNKTGIKGVCYLVKRNRWKAQIACNNKVIHLGYFKTLDEAKLARQSKALELYGDFLNECEK
ncbi:MAG: hypothetical protein GY756_13725 [bacterium]|nr:hypothetical protein [bacterium]